jgi:hypothetical protein
MYRIPYLKTKIGQTYIVYLKNSNHYIQLEEPAWFVFSRLREGYRPTTTAQKFSERYSISYNESLVFVNNFKRELQGLIPQSKLDKNPDSLIYNSFHLVCSKTYLINNCKIQFSFSTDYLCSMIHPLLNHFEVENSEKPTDQFELYHSEKKIFLRVNGQIAGDWTFEETAYVKGVIFMQMANIIYKKTTNEWLMTFHASAVSNGESTILFTAPPNHGKTTFAMLLKNAGYRLISDDFIPVDHSGLTYPFPLSVSIRQSADVLNDVVPGLTTLPVKHINSEKSVRFVSFNEEYSYGDFILPIKAIVFIKYDKNTTISSEKLPSEKAIQPFFEQTWISPGSDVAEKLFGILPKIEFYNLIYSDFDKALSFINNLFNSNNE